MGFSKISRVIFFIALSFNLFFFLPKSHGRSSNLLCGTFFPGSDLSNLFVQLHSPAGTSRFVVTEEADWSIKLSETVYLNPSKRWLRIGGKAVKLSINEYQLMEELAFAMEYSLHREQLMELIFPDGRTENNLRTLMARLYQKIDLIGDRGIVQTDRTTEKIVLNLGQKLSSVDFGNVRFFPNQRVFAIYSSSERRYVRIPTIRQAMNIFEFFVKSKKGSVSIERLYHYHLENKWYKDQETSYLGYYNNIKVQISVFNKAYREISGSSDYFLVIKDGNVVWNYGAR